MSKRGIVLLKQIILFLLRFFCSCLERFFSSPKIKGIVRIIKKGKTIVSFFGKDAINEQIIGTIASILISSKIVDTSKVLIAIAKSEENTVKISGRTTTQLVEKGIDIGTAFQEALAKVDPEYEAGGHNIAAGARVSKTNRTKFLNAVDKIFSTQLEKK